MAMYMQPEPFELAHTGMRIGRLGGAAVAVSVAGVLFLGIRPNRLLDLAKTTGDGLRAGPAGTTPPPPASPPGRPRPQCRPCNSPAPSFPRMTTPGPWA